MKDIKRKYGNHIITITHPDKFLFTNITKQEVIDYYQAIAPYMLPYLKNRPLMMQRAPDGIFGEFFYQKDASDYFPSWIKRALVPKAGGYNNYVVCQNAATLAYLASQACITPHLWLSRVDKLDYPDRMIFDLDPSTNNFDSVRRVAFMLKELLEKLGLSPFIMTTGSHGAHVTVPLVRTVNFDSVKAFADKCADYIYSQNPKEITRQIRKEKRGKSVFIDIFRNQFGATAVAPYAIRMHEGAPVATPLSWHEFKDKAINSQSYNIKNIFNRLKKIDDPWKMFSKSAGSLKKAEKNLESIMNA